jgi:hypothetical protein
MTQIIDDIDTHMGAAGAIERAALVPGMYLAWCVNLQLVSQAFTEGFEREMLRVRYRDLSPGAFFVKATGGSLTAAQLSERGQLFAQHYYATYRAGVVPALYDAKDDWDTYDTIAPSLTKAYYAFADGGHKVAQSGRHWWQVWR